MTRLRIALVALLLAAGVGVTASRLEVAEMKPYDVAVIPRAATLRWLALGHPTLAANLYWLRAVQYLGEPRADERGWEKLLPIVDLVTDLDPKHGYAYQVAGVMLGAAGRTGESSAILEKGIRNVPDRYILPYLRAFNAFYYDDDWAAAGRFAEIAATTPGAPDRLRQNVLAYYVKGNRADAAVAFLEESLAQAGDPESRKAVEGQLKQAILERDVARLDEAVAAWRREALVGPLALEQLVVAGLVPSIPPDPHGGELYVGTDGRVRSTANPFRFSRPEPISRRAPEPGIRRGSSPKVP